MRVRAGLFLDRDGTIVEDAGYMSHPDQMILLPGAREAMRIALRHFRVYLVTNQSGIGRGYLTHADVEACNRRMFELLDLPPDSIHGVCIAPETPTEPPLYRKPSPRYLTEMIARDGLDADSCWMVGDRLSDLQCGRNAGIRSALVRQSEHAELAETRAFAEQHLLPVFENLLEVVRALTAGMGSGPCADSFSGG